MRAGIGFHFLHLSPVFPTNYMTARHGLVLTVLIRTILCSINTPWFHWEWHVEHQMYDMYVITILRKLILPGKGSSLDQMTLQNLDREIVKRISGLSAWVWKNCNLIATEIRRKQWVRHLFAPRSAVVAIHFMDRELFTGVGLVKIGHVQFSDFDSPLCEAYFFADPPLPHLHP